MRSGQDADFWSIGYDMVEMPKKTLKLKQPLPPAKAKRGGRGKRPAAKARPEVKADGSARLAAFTVLKDILVNNMVSDAALAQSGAGRLAEALLLETAEKLQERRRGLVRGHRRRQNVARPGQVAEAGEVVASQLQPRPVEAR